MKSLKLHKTGARGLPERFAASRLPEKIDSAADLSNNQRQPWQSNDQA